MSTPGGPPPGRGLTELEQLVPDQDPGDYIRRPGAGRKPATISDPTLAPALLHLVDPVTRGDPESPLLWVSKSTRDLAQALPAPDLGGLIGKLPSA